MKNLFVFLCLSIYSIPLFSQEVLKIDDSLNGSTKGNMEGGQFVEGGWQATDGFNSRIVYDLGVAYGKGRLEYDVTNFLPCSQPNNEKCHIVTMYQGENQDRDSAHAQGESYFIVRTGTGYFDPCEYKILTRPICEPGQEVDYEARVETGFSWDPQSVYKYSIEWWLDGKIVVKRDDQVIYDYTHIYPPYYRYILIGRDRTTKPNYGEQPGVIYSNVKIYVDESSKLVIPPCSGYDAGIQDVTDILDSGTEDVGGELKTTTLYPLDDTFVSKSQPDTVFGLLDNFQVGGDGSGKTGRIVFLKFDLRDLKNSEIYSAKLNMYVSNSGYGGGISRLGNNNWEEETLTYNNMPLVDEIPMVDIGMVTSGEWISVDIKNLLSYGEVSSINIISTIDDGAAYLSKENTAAEKRPYIEIEYRSGLVDAGIEDIRETQDIIEMDRGYMDYALIDDMAIEDDLSTMEIGPQNDIDMDIMDDVNTGIDISDLGKSDRVEPAKSDTGCSCSLLW